jgi:hypothetical protein
MRSTSAVTTALTLLLGIGAADAADPTLLAETGGFLLGNAHRCGVAVERVEHAGNGVASDFRPICCAGPSSWPRTMRAMPTFMR